MFMYIKSMYGDMVKSKFYSRFAHFMISLLFLNISLREFTWKIQYAVPICPLSLIEIRWKIREQAAILVLNKDRDLLSVDINFTSDI